MEKALNWKLGEVQKVETHDQDEEEVPGESYTGAEDESVSGIAVNGDPEPVTEISEKDDSYEAVPYEKSAERADSGEEEEEKLVRESVVESVEPQVSSPDKGLEALVEQVEAPGDVAALVTRVTKENISQALNETDRNSEVVDQPIVLSLGANAGSFPLETDVIPKASEQMPLASYGEEKGIERIALPSPDESCEVPPAMADVVPRVKNPQESASTSDLELSGNVNESSQEAANAGSADSKSEIPVNSENQPVTSLSHRSLQPTSWRSCCGILEILRSSNS